jgi:hypothetical protein
MTSISPMTFVPRTYSNGPQPLNPFLGAVAPAFPEKVAQTAVSRLQRDVFYSTADSVFQHCKIKVNALDGYNTALLEQKGQFIEGGNWLKAFGIHKLHFLTKPLEQGAFATFLSRALTPILSGLDMMNAYQTQEISKQALSSQATWLATQTGKALVLIEIGACLQSAIIAAVANPILKVLVSSLASTALYCLTHKEV